jgi:hypothetical protein
LYRFKIRFFLSDEAIQLPSYKHVSINEAIVLLQNLPVWSDEAIQFLNYKHISLDEAIVSLQNPSVLSDKAIRPLLQFVKRSADTIGRYRCRYRRIGQSELRPPLHLGHFNCIFFEQLSVMKSSAYSFAKAVSNLHLISKNSAKIPQLCPHDHRKI